MKNINTDIAIAGGGPGGLAAALAAAQLGKKAVVFEKSDHLGGAMNGGTGPFAVDTIQQRRFQRVVTREQAFHFFMDYTHWQTDPGLVSAYVNKSADTIRWLEDVGCNFEVLIAYIEGGNHTWHMNDMSRGFICENIWKAAEKFGVQAYLSSPVKKIIMKDGRAAGFIAQSETEGEIQVNAGAVIVATGGFGSNAEMVRKYTPYELGKTMANMSPNTDGDGLNMVWEAGGARGKMFFDAFVSMVPPHLGGPGGFCTELRIFRQPNLLVNKYAARFTDETAMNNGAHGINTVRRQPDTCAYMIVTDEIVEHYKKDGFPITLPTRDPFTNEYSDWPQGFEEKMDKEIAVGCTDLFTADSVKELAQKTGLNSAQLLQTIETYNAACDAGIDRMFFKRRNYLLPVRGKKYYAAKVCAAGYGTLGGININGKAEVLDDRSLPIPGLYAAGNDANSICHDSYCFAMPGHTSGFAFNTGRIAAESASAYIK